MACCEVLTVDRTWGISQMSSPLSFDGHEAHLAALHRTLQFWLGVGTYEMPVALVMYVQKLPLRF
jgi:hypothetical protein